MYSKSKICKFVVLGAIALTISCAPALYVPVMNEVTSNPELADLKAGRQLYINKCGGCHTLILPEKHTAGQWAEWMTKMEHRAGATSAESELILKYLTKGSVK